MECEHIKLYYLLVEHADHEEVRVALGDGAEVLKLVVLMRVDLHLGSIVWTGCMDSECGRGGGQEYDSGGIPLKLPSAPPPSHALLYHMPRSATMMGSSNPGLARPVRILLSSVWRWSRAAFIGLRGQKRK